MDTLSELINIVNRKRLSKIDVLDKTFLNSKSPNLYYKLYHAIESKAVKTDDDAGKFLYGTGKEDPRYRMLKSRLKDKLFKSLLLLNSDDIFESEIQKKLYYECLLNYIAIETIIKSTGMTKLVYSLIKENYPSVKRYHFYDIQKKYSYSLLLYYSLKGDRKSFYKEEHNFFKISELLEKEYIAKHIYNKISIQFVSGIRITSELLSEIKSGLDKLNSIRSDIDSPEVDFYYYYSLLMYYECTNNIEDILSICSKAENILIQQPHIVNNAKKIIILLYRAKALLNSRKYFDGLELIKRSDDIILISSNYNWFVLKEFEFKLYLQDNRIQEAVVVYQEVVKNKYLKRQVEQLSEKWKIFNAYLVFMDSYLNKGDYKFSIPKFLNDVPVNSKDKSGYNFSIRVIEMLFMFGRKQYNVVFHKMEALRVYRSRYLNDNTYQRNHLFLSVLLKAEKTGFNGREMQKADWPELQELRKLNNHIIADWEIIPYEVLWEIIVDLAKK